ncbi:MAG: SOS response-associated peptidase family protein [Pseudomonadota bacterium]|nr:SOS response-associated peptidase family protein [Pseudomonadota bacterium]
MCNLYRLEKNPDAIRRLFADAGIELGFPEGVPNLPPVDVHITDRAPIVRNGLMGAELVVRRWSWPNTSGKPLYNMKSEGRSFGDRRCLAIGDGFYEYTAAADPKAKRKDRWLFRPVEGDLIGIAALWRDHPDVGEAFTLLTAEPGEDVKPIHHRQIVLIPPQRWADWLDPSVPSRDLLMPTPANFLSVEAAPTP